MIKTPLSTVIGGAFWTPGATILGSASKTINQLIKSLFSNNEQGFAYDPNDLTTLYQDAAGTVPVTAAGQPVGLMKDKSGRNNNAFQTVSSSRPILQRNATTGAYYLAFDGVDDFLQTNNIDFSATDKVSLFAGVRKLSDVSTGMLCELSANLNINVGCFYLAAPLNVVTKSFAFMVKGTVVSGVPATSTNNLAPYSAVLSAKGDILVSSVSLRSNGVPFNSSVTLGTGSYGNHPLYIGRRGGIESPFNGHIYSLIGIGRLATDSETIALEKYIAKNTGVTLSV